MIANNTLSVRSWRTRRERRAPSASRTEVCILRAAPRASSRLAMLAHAISRTSPDRAISSRSPFEVSLSNVAIPPGAGSIAIFCFVILLRSSSPIVLAPSALLNHCCNCNVTFDSTCAGDTPALRRPITYSQCTLGLFSIEVAPRMAGSVASGSQKSGGLSVSLSPKNSAAATPTTVK